MASLLVTTNLFFFGNSTNQQTAGETEYTALRSMEVTRNDGLGCYLLDAHENIVFVLFPREEVLENNGNNVFEDIEALNTLQKGKDRRGVLPNVRVCSMTSTRQ